MRDPGPGRRRLARRHILSLLESGRLDELWSHVDGLEETGAEELSARAMPLPEIEYGPLYRRPRKIWGMVLNYVEHAGGLEETAPSEEPASFVRSDMTIIGRARRYGSRVSRGG